jgi:enolase 1/2/3
MPVLDPAITSVCAHRRWDSRGRPTVEVVVSASVARGRGIAPAGASTGSAEALDRRDGGPRFGGYGVDDALLAVNGRIAPALIGLDVSDQDACDAAIEALDPSAGFATLGGNAAVATSLAIAHASADLAGVPLWRLIDPDAARMPVPEVQIFGGGAHAHRRLDLQDLMVVPHGAGTFAEALDWAAEVYRAAGLRLEERGAIGGVADEGGWWPDFSTNAHALEALTQAIERSGLRPGQDASISVDVASTQLLADGRYHLHLEETSYDRARWCALVLSWLDDFPIVSIEDPCAEEDAEGMAMVVAGAGLVQVVGDDFLVTDAGRIAVSAEQGTATAALIKPNQAGTLTRARAALVTAHRNGMSAIVSARSGETEDVTVAHLAVGWRAGGIKVGSITRGERTAKWNELLRIEEDLGGAATFAGADGLKPPNPNTSS